MVFDGLAYLAPGARALLLDAQHGGTAFFDGVRHRRQCLLGFADVQRDAALCLRLKILVLLIGVLDRRLHITDARCGLVHFAAHQSKSSSAGGDDGGKGISAYQR